MTGRVDRGVTSDRELRDRERVVFDVGVIGQDITCNVGVFGVRTRIGDADWRVVRAVDGHGDRLVYVGTEVVRDADREVLDDRLARLEGLRRREVIVQGVGPDACGGVDREGTVECRRRADDRPGLGSRGVDIRCGQGTRGDGRAGNARAHFCHRAGLGGVEVGDDWCVVRAVDGDGDRLVHRRTLVVRRADRVSLGDRLAFRQGLGRREAVV